MTHPDIAGLAERRPANPWPLMGYAPGRYTCQCTTCGERFEGDKRAVTCLPCASSQANDALQALDAELAEAKGANATLVGQLAEALVDRNAARFRATTAEAEAKAMREALEPFVVGEAAMEELLWGDLPDEATGTITAKLGDFRRARRALGGTDAK